MGQQIVIGTQLLVDSLSVMVIVLGFVSQIELVTIAVNSTTMSDYRLLYIFLSKLPIAMHLVFQQIF